MVDNQARRFELSEVRTVSLWSCEKTDYRIGCSQLLRKQLLPLQDFSSYTLIAKQGITSAKYKRGLNTRITYINADTSIGLIKLNSQEWW